MFTMRETGISAQIVAVTVAVGLGVACHQGPRMCSGGQICPIGTECAAAQEVCIPAGGCGNGTLDRGEHCDDGNIVSGDGCSATCRRELAVGGAHTCIVQDGDTMRCWGLGSSGQLGHGQRSNIGDDEPALRQGVYLGGDAVRELAAGDKHTCALLQTGDVRCWGAGDEGQLGYGHTMNIGDDEVPASQRHVEIGGAVTQLVAGDGHTCALLDTGAVRCWGSGDGGRLGYGNQDVNEDVIGDDEHPASVGDVPVGGKVTQLAAGREHTCALLDTGNVRCWGKGEYGRLGYGNTFDIGDDETPEMVEDVPVGGRIRQLTAGHYHTCALLETGAVRCWGRGLYGQLGYGHTDSIGDRETPEQAGDIPLGGVTIIQIAAGHSHTCVLLDTGAVRCWGRAEKGELGYGNVVEMGDDETLELLPDIQLGGLVVQIAVGGRHACAVLDTGAVRCWGSGTSGQLGHGERLPIGNDELPQVAGDVPLGGRVTQLAAGGAHTCALLDTGAVRCWGLGSDGQLGYGDPDGVGNDELPRDLFGIVQDSEFVEIAAGARHTCALSGLHAVYCWGEGSEGQLGNGTGDNRGDDGAGEAVSVHVGGVVTHIATGEAHSCALLESGAVRCWGRGAHGQLGYGSAGNVGDDEWPDVAGDIELGGVAVQVVAGARHTCALLDTGAVRCWGSHESGQLGIGPSSESNIGDDEFPAVVGDVQVGGPVVQLAAAGSHTCALLDDHTARCWGANGAGQLGYGVAGNIGDDKLPRDAGPVPVGAPVMQLAVGELHTCVLLDTGAVRCWGSGESGRLGYGTDDDIDDASVAGDIDLGGPAVAIAAGSAHTCAMLGRGRYRCWGSGQDGRLGYGNTDDVGAAQTPASAGDVPSE